MKQLPLAIALDTPRSLDSFVPGSNTMALQQVAAFHAGSAPLYLWGPAGSGKTHLLQALAARFAQAGGQVGWFGADDSLPWPHDETRALIVFDDCERFDPARQHAAFGLFVDATALGIPIAAAGRLPPVDLPLRDDLRTRLGWGHVVAMQPLSEAESRAAMRREADRRGLFLSDEVMGYLLTHFERDMKHLMAMLDRLDTFSLASKRAITVPLLKQMLAEEDT